MAEPITNQYQPDTVSVPGDSLRELLDDRLMTPAELADRIGRSKRTVHEIIRGTSAITAETSLQLERVLGVPASFWNNLERNYRDHLTRRE